MQSVPFQLRFLLASYPDLMGKALGIVTRCIATDLIHRAGFTRNTARTGAVSFIQRFGSALNLNVHFHILFLDGVYSAGFDDQKQVFRRVNAPTKADLEVLLHRISTRLAQFLVKAGILEQDIEHSYLNLEHLKANRLRQTTQAGVQHRYQGMRKVQRGCEDHSLYRRPRGD